MIMQKSAGRESCYLDLPLTMILVHLPCRHYLGGKNVVTRFMSLLLLQVHI